jgi:hypothetical protein
MIDPYDEVLEREHAEMRKQLERLLAVLRAARRATHARWPTTESMDDLRRAVEQCGGIE